MTSEWVTSTTRAVSNKLRGVKIILPVTTLVRPSITPLNSFTVPYSPPHSVLWFHYDKSDVSEVTGASLVELFIFTPELWHRRKERLSWLGSLELQALGRQPWQGFFATSSQTASSCMKMTSTKRKKSEFSYVPPVQVKSMASMALRLPYLLSTSYLSTPFRANIHQPKNPNKKWPPRLGLRRSPLNPRHQSLPKSHPGPRQVSRRSLLLQTPPPS